jgi:hypothetical protein
MPTTYAIPDGRVAMAATTYTGTNTTLPVSNAVNGVGFQPDWVWVKNRTTATAHMLQDSVRGATAYINSNTTSAENTNTASDWFRSFDSNGFTVSNLTTGGSSTIEWNNAGYNYVGWQWKAGGAAVSNTAGSITSSVSANTTAGFSVVTYTGTGANATVGHGLGVAPSMIIVKSRSATFTWRVYHASIGNGNVLFLSATDASTAESTAWNSTTPTSSVFSVGTSSGTNGSAGTYVAYCFAPVAGYSAFGSYTGNGSTDGPFVYLGFRPRFLTIKASSFAGESWYLFDTTRNTFNVIGEALVANQSSAEFSFVMLDVLSNGFKARTTNSLCNTSGATYIYYAVAENPFAYSNAR